MAPTLSTPFRPLVIRRLGHSSFQNHPQKWSVVTSSTPRLSHRLHPLSSFKSSMTTRASSNPPPPTPPKLYGPVRVVVKGRVQGFSTGTGRLRTPPSSLSGTPDSVQEMEQRCRRGPPDAMVTGFEVVPCSDDPGTGFQRKPTV
ncbi:hypothetical protein AAG906_014559 [Vitis piasezkii]